MNLFISIDEWFWLFFMCVLQLNFWYLNHNFSGIFILMLSKKTFRYKKTAIGKTIAVFEANKLTFLWLF